MTKLRDKYRYIFLWGKYLGSLDYYINAQIELAEKDGAPENAIYKDHRGKWQTFDMVTNERTLDWFRKVEAMVEEGTK